MNFVSWDPRSEIGDLEKERECSFYFVLLVTARWHSKLPSGGGFFLAEMTCNSGKLCYNHDTLEWDVDSALGGGGLTHTIDPYWSRGRLRAEEKYLAAAGGSKSGSEKPLGKAVNAKSENRNPKWSWMWW